MNPKDKRKLRKEKRRIDKKRSNGKNINRHHIICSSRDGADTPKNIAYVDMYLHRDYHKLFDNKVPEEIINYLIDYFWKGQTEHVYNALSKRNQGVKQ